MDILPEGAIRLTGFRKQRSHECEKPVITWLLRTQIGSTEKELARRLRISAERVASTSRTACRMRSASLPTG